MTTKEEAERLAGYLERFTVKVRPSHNGTLSQVVALLRQQAAEIERLKAEVQAKSDVLAGSLKAQVPKDALLRQALEALSAVQGVVASRGVALYPVINEIKTHLGEQA